MTASVRSTSTHAATGSETSFTITLPSGWQAGDVCYIAVEDRGTGASITTPTGYTAVAAVFNPSGQTNTAMAVYRRVLQGGDTGPAITVVSGRATAVALAVQNADGTTPEDGVTPSEAAQSAATNSPVANSVTPTGSDDLLLCFFGCGNPTTGNTQTWTQPTGMTLEVTANSNVAAVTNSGVMAASLALTSNAATGTKTATITQSSGSTACNSQAVTLVVKSAAVSAPALPPGGARRVPYRVPALPPERRFRAVLVPPAQEFLFAEAVQRRQEWPRGLPRRARVTFAVPKQLNPPYPFTEVRQWRQPRGFFPRRGRQAMPVPAQQAAPAAPAFVPVPLRHARLTALTVRRGHVLPPVPPQLNPPYPFTWLRQWRQPKGALPRRGHRFEPVPAQQAAPQAPAFVPQLSRHAKTILAGTRRRVAQHIPGQAAPAPALSRPRLRPRPGRRGRTAQTVPAQVTVTPPARVNRHRAPVRALALMRRRFAQLLPWPQAQQPPFSIGALTGATAATTTVAGATAANALAGSTAPSGAISATDQRTGGPG